MAVADLVFHNIHNVLNNGRTEDVLGWRSPLFSEMFDPHVMRLLQHLAVYEGRVEAGVNALSDALRDDPDNVRWRTLRAGILRHAGHTEQAVIDLAVTFTAAPPDDETLRIFIDLVLQAKCYNRAVDALDALARRFPNHALVHDLLGSILQLLHRNAEAIPYHKRAIELDPRNPDFANNFGTTLRQLGAFNEAERYLRHALTLHPGHYMAWYNLGNVLRMTRRTRESIQAYRNSIAIRGDYPESHFTLACSLLQLGEWHEGWREWEWRFRSAAIVPPIDIELPLWDGSDPRGKRIVVVAEQGSGDTLQFVRYTQLLAQRGAIVTIWAPKETATLLARLPYIVAASQFRADMPASEMYVPMMSLPRLLQVGPLNIPPAPYIAVDLERTIQFAQALGPRRKRLRLGIAWAGNPIQGDDGFRSAELAALTPLFNDPDIEWIGVQKGPRAAEIAQTGFPIADWSDALHSFDDTAALFMNLDGVVSVCTGPVHLAGAMGLPAICMLSTAADWRWCDDENTTIWYDSMRLIRQARQGDWHEVAMRSAQLLRTLVPRVLPIDEIAAQTEPQSVQNTNLQPQLANVQGPVPETVATVRADLEFHDPAGNMQRESNTSNKAETRQIAASSNKSASVRKSTASAAVQSETTSASDLRNASVPSAKPKTGAGAKTAAGTKSATRSKLTFESNGTTAAKPAKQTLSKATAKGATVQSAPSVRAKQLKLATAKQLQSAKIKRTQPLTSEHAQPSTSKQAQTSKSKQAQTSSSKRAQSSTTKQVNSAKTKHVEIPAAKPGRTLAAKSTRTSNVKHLETPNTKRVESNASTRSGRASAAISTASTTAKQPNAAVKKRSVQVAKSQTATQAASSLGRSLEKSPLKKSALKRPVNAKTAVTTRFSSKPKSSDAVAGRAKPVARKATNARR